MYFEAKTKRLTVTERNTYKTVKELWLLDSESYTEAEAKVNEYMGKTFPKEDFQITKIQPSKIKETCTAKNCDENAAFFKVKVETIELNEKGKEIRTSEFILVKADSSGESVEKASEVFADSVNEFEVVKTEKTKFSGII